MKKLFVILIAFLFLPFVCNAQKSRNQTTSTPCPSYTSTKSRIETKTLKTVYALKNNASVGYIEYIEQLAIVEEIKTSGYWDNSHHTVTNEERYFSHYSQGGDGAPIYGTREVTKWVGGCRYSDHILSSKTDTTYIKKCGCNKDFTAGDFKVSNLYPDWSTMNEEQIKDWLIKNCNQETVDKLHNDLIDKKIRENFYQKPE